MRTVFFEVLSTSTLVALAAIAAQGKWPQRTRRAVVIARVEEPRIVQRTRIANAQIEDAVRRAATYERIIGRTNDPAARYEAMVATRLPTGSSMNVDAVANGARDAQRCSA